MQFEKIPVEATTSTMSSETNQNTSLKDNPSPHSSILLQSNVIGQSHDLPVQQAESLTPAAQNESLPNDDPPKTEEDEYVVYWDEPVEHDPANPMNWSPLRKKITIAIVSFMTFLTPLASSMFAPGVPEVIKEFNSNSDTLASFVVAIYVLGFAFGPLVVAPISELKGRTIVYHTCNILFFIFTILNAVSQNMAMLVAFRFLAGVAGVAPITIGSGTIADLIPPERRGLAMSVWSVGPILGPVIGPIAGGYLSQALGWRWVFWVLAIAAGVATIAGFLVLRETFPPVLLERKAAQLRKSTGNPLYRSKLASDIPPKTLFIRSILRPSKMLIFSPIVTLMSIYIAVLYGLLYILFTTFTFVYQERYGFSTGSAGLAFIGSGVGTLCGIATTAKFSDRRIRLRRAKGETPQPEDRLPIYLVLPASLAIPSGLFLYGWGAAEKVHWILPQIGNALTGFGMIVIVMCVQTYLVDAFTLHAASAIAANTVLRSVLGGLLPLCGLQLYDAIGLGWGNSLLGFIAFAMAPIPVLFGMIGARVRNSKMGRVVF